MTGLAPDHLLAAILGELRLIRLALDRKPALSAPDRRLLAALADRAGHGTTFSARAVW